MEEEVEANIVQNFIEIESFLTFQFHIKKTFFLKKNKIM